MKKQNLLAFSNSIMHTASEPSGRINSMDQHFWLQNIKIYQKNNNKKNDSLPNIPACTRLVLAKLVTFFCPSLNIWQIGIFYYILFMIYFNILKSNVLVHWIDPTARFGHGVNVMSKMLPSNLQALSISRISGIAKR